MTKHNLERLFFVVAAIVAVGVMAATIRFEVRMAKQKTLFYQLQALRTSVNLFKSIVERNPASFGELVEGEFSFPGEGFRRRYVEEVPDRDDKGDLVDPFGNPYVYNPGTGWLRSSTWGYELW